MNKKKITAKEISDQLAISFPKGLSEVNYNYEAYLERQLNEVIKENEKLRNGIKKFLDKNFKGGSKVDREDYVQMVSCKDIWDLKQLID
jgi:hypothetical protein